MVDLKERIARRVARELNDGDVVNLGIGLPTMVAECLPEGVDIILQSENGIMGMGSKPILPDEDVINAGAQYVSILPGGQYFDSATSFAIIRGGHVDATVLGALEVDRHGNIANWTIPGKLVPGMGGAMDLCSGVKKIVVATEHCEKNGQSKILKQCTLPLTGARCVTDIVTDRCYFEVTQEGLVLRELAPGYTVEDIRACTEADFLVPDEIGVME